MVLMWGKGIGLFWRGENAPVKGGCPLHNHVEQQQLYSVKLFSNLIEPGKCNMSAHECIFIHQARK